MFHWAGRCKNNHFFKWLFFCIFVFINSYLICVTKEDILKNVWDKDDVDEKREKKIIVSIVN